MAYKKKSFGILLVSIILTFTILYVLGLLVTPKFITEIKEGSLIREYYFDKHENEVIFVGDCEVFESFVPSFLEEKYGIKSFVRGSAAQRMWQSYYLMKETLNYERPKIFVLSVQELMYGENTKEEYNRMTLDGMRWSMQKVKSIQTSMNPEERFLDYLFPLLRYHERIFRLKGEDFLYAFSKPLISDRGYLINRGVKPMGKLPPVKPLGDGALPEKSMNYLRKIVELCKQEEVKLFLIKAPIPYPHWHQEWEEEVRAFAKENHLTYLNFLTLNQKTGIDMQTDTYDAGLHLNYNGALKLTDYMGKILSDQLQEQ